MHFFHAWRQRHHRHAAAASSFFFHHRGFHRHGHPGFFSAEHGDAAWDERQPERHGDRTERLLERLSARLDLTAAQQERLADLLARLQSQRRTLKALSRGPELRTLFAGENLDRTAAQALWDERLDALRRAGPGLVDALGEFFDGLDFEQQQALRFVMRRHGRGRDER